MKISEKARNNIMLKFVTISGENNSWYRNEMPESGYKFFGKDRFGRDFKVFTEAEAQKKCGI